MLHFDIIFVNCKALAKKRLENPIPHFGNKLTALLEDRGTNVSKISKHLDVSRQTTTRYKEQSQMPEGIYKFLLMCKELQISPNYFISDNDLKYFDKSAKNNILLNSAEELNDEDLKDVEKYIDYLVHKRHFQKRKQVKEKNEITN